MLVNLTPHPLNILNDDDQIALTLRPAGRTPRIDMYEHPAKSEYMDGFEVKIVESEKGEVKHLPEPQAGVTLIVPFVVRMLLPERTDLVSPGRLVRLEDRAPFGCRELVRSKRKE